jgi:iron complex transport system ATP-binding protein
MTTHYPEHIAQCNAHGTLLMRDNERVSGGVDDLLTTQMLRKAYGIDCLVMDVDAPGRTIKICQPIIDN